MDNKATIDLVLSAPEGLVSDGLARELYESIAERSKLDLGLEDVQTKISVIPNQSFKYIEQLQPSP